MIVLDMSKGAGCTGHPAVRLPSLLSQYSNMRELSILFDPSELPLEALRIILARHGYSVSELRVEAGGLILAVVKKGG